MALFQKDWLNRGGRSVVFGWLLFLRSRSYMSDQMKQFVWKMTYDFVLTAGLLSLAGAIALGKVHQESSYGLPEIIGILATLAGGVTHGLFDSRSQLTNGGNNGKREENAKEGQETSQAVLGG